ncbi:MAG TPA: ATP-binding cassette domain-containing protein [Steroidobacteraceae bacterium]|nr:ATP-binding cassette domain-containing protein [Steroidobacteraceae bacterium]
MTRRAPNPLPFLGGLLAIYLLAPIVAGVRQSARSDWSAVDWSVLWHACAISIGSASVSTAILALTGIPLAYVLARHSGRIAATVGFIVQLPLALPPLASGILLLFLVGYQGPFGRFAARLLTDSFAGIVLAQTFVAAPFVVIAARSAFAAIDSDLEGVAATLGHRPLDVFLRVGLPGAKYGLLSGLLLAWLRAFGEFGATVMVAYHPYSLPVYSYVAFGAQGLPAMLPILLPTLALALAVMGLGSLVGARAEIRPPPRRRGPSAAPPAAAMARSSPKPPSDDGSGCLALRLDHSIGDFRLRFQWSPSARRLAILGPSGSGKSLTLKLIAGIEREDSAAVRLGDRDLSGLEPADRGVAYVPQSYGLLPHLDVTRQLLFARDADPREAAHWIVQLGLQELADRRPAALSLGQQQRVALARALARRAPLLLLDEPFSALDAPLRGRLRRELRELQRGFPGTTVLVTHDPTEAALLADELLVLESGLALQTGRTAEVFRRPASETVGRLLGADNVAAGIAAGPRAIDVGGGVTVAVDGPDLRPGERVGWSFAAQRAHLAPTGAYAAVVEEVVEVGMLRDLTVRLGEARVRVAGASTPYARGESCRFDLDPGAIQVWPFEDA